MSREERVRVLQMVASGTVSPEEADEVLAALEPAPAAQFGEATPIKARSPRGNPEMQRTLVIEIHDGEKNITVRVPPGLARAQQQFLARHAGEHLGEHGIDLQELLENVQQFPKDTTLVDMSEDEFSLEIKTE